MAGGKDDILRGTLDLLVLKTLDTLGPLHGYGIARRIEQVSENLLHLNQGTLYPALLRLEQRGWISSKWGTSDNNRRARYYSLTKSGKKQLAREAESWERMAGMIARLLEGEATGWPESYGRGSKAGSTRYRAAGVSAHFASTLLCRRRAILGLQISPEELFMAFRDIFPATVASAEKAQGERLPPILFGEVPVERLAQQSRDRNALTAREHAEIVLDGLIEKYGGPFHMTYSSIHGPGVRA
jgi:PadR family transcriptional regulator, regulatory protein PadR